MNRIQLSILLVCLAVLLPASRVRAGECDEQQEVRWKAECITDAHKPDAIAQLLRLALATTKGSASQKPPSSDFLYVAEEAGEAARHLGFRPLVELAAAKDRNKAIFAARALTAFLDAVKNGYSHNRQFNGEGDPKMFAKAQEALRAPCVRLSKHENAGVQADGKRCLDEIRGGPGLGGLLSKPTDLQGIGPAPAGGPGSRLGGIRGGR
jgi:hypothetical protein